MLPARTPMQWDSSEFAGFSNTKPWLRLSPSYKRVNVAVQKEDPYSQLSFYRQLVQLRQSEPSLMSGDYKPVYADQQLMAYIRQAPSSQPFLVVLNLSHKPAHQNHQSHQRGVQCRYNRICHSQGLSWVMGKRA